MNAKLTPAQIAEARAHYRAREQAKQAEREARRLQALQAAETLIPTILARYPSIENAYLFGSVVRQNAFHAESDIDIAVRGLAVEDYASLWTELEEALAAWAVDLRPLPDEGLFTEMVYLTGKKIYEREDTAFTG